LSPGENDATDPTRPREVVSNLLNFTIRLTEASNPGWNLQFLPNKIFKASSVSIEDDGHIPALVTKRGEISVFIFASFHCFLLLPQSPKAPSQVGEVCRF
jgi:hypothetical protein